MGTKAEYHHTIAGGASRMTRRQVMSMAVAAPVWTSIINLRAQSPRLLKIGATTSAFALRAQPGAGATAFDIIEHCRRLGLGGVQMPLQAIELELAQKLGKRVKGYGMQLILDSPALPVEEGQLYRFDFALRACNAAGAVCLRAALAQPRYEQFESGREFQRSFERLKSQVSLAIPMLEKNRIRLAIENHGDWRATDLADWIDRLGSEFVGVCFDFAGSMTLCEAPLDTLRTLAPYIFMCHIKDVAVEKSEDGFLLSEVPLGDGFLSLKEMIQVLHAKNPGMPLYLDVTTGDPVRVPVTIDKYRSAISLPEEDVTKILDVVSRNLSKNPLTRISGLAQAAAVKLEDEAVTKSIEWARKNLKV